MEVKNSLLRWCLSHTSFIVKRYLLNISFDQSWNWQTPNPFLSVISTLNLTPQRFSQREYPEICSTFFAIRNPNDVIYIFVFCYIDVGSRVCHFGLKYCLYNYLYVCLEYLLLIRSPQKMHVRFRSIAKNISSSVLNTHEYFTLCYVEIKILLLVVYSMKARDSLQGMLVLIATF